MEARDTLTSVREIYTDALCEAASECERLSALYWKAARAIEAVDECHACRALSDKGHALLDEHIEALNRMAAVLHRAEYELRVTIGDKS